MIKMENVTANKNGGKNKNYEIGEDDKYKKMTTKNDKWDKKDIFIGGPINGGNHQNLTYTRVFSFCSTEKPFKCLRSNNH